MATDEYLRILGDGLLAWNDWRLRHPYLQIDFGGRDLREFELSLSIADPHTFGEETTPLGTRGIDFAYAKLVSANLEGQDLSHANFMRADLGGARLAGATLWNVNFDGADLRLADFERSRFGAVSWGNCDLRGALGLQSASHVFPSSIDIRAVRRAGLPAVFLSGCGLPPDLREYLPSILDNVAITKYSCFISYCTADTQFVERLHRDLENARIRSWYAPMEMRAGDRIRDRLDDAVALSEKLLVVLSATSIASQYVEQEVEAALEKERSERRLVLVPIMLDRAVFETSSGWPSYLRRTRHIADFTTWHDWSRYRSALERLTLDIKQTTLSALPLGRADAG